MSRTGGGIVDEDAPLAVFELGDWIATTGEPSRGKGDDGDNVHAESNPDSPAKWKESRGGVSIVAFRENGVQCPRCSLRNCGLRSAAHAQATLTDQQA